MRKIKCPKCGEEFALSRSAYDTILEQVKTDLFEKEISDYKKALDTEKHAEIQQYKQQQEASSAERLSRLTEQYRRQQIKCEEILKEKDEEILRIQDFRAKQSTKMIGENLEIHCEAEFNKIRMVAFPNAYFEKDNDARQGSKGDFIFKEVDESGVEIISIMFEMKNESDSTSTKRKNEDFFKELDRDRKQKKCEYAVLVSMLEKDNDFYNSGIADVSFKYPKMYVIRPQCFISLISLLRNAALNTIAYKKELASIKNRSVDIANFEIQMEEFKDRFGRNFRIANDKFEGAISEIDKAISSLQKTKEDLLSSSNNLRLANEKAQALSMEKLLKPATSKRSKKQ